MIDTGSYWLTFYANNNTSESNALLVYWNDNLVLLTPSFPAGGSGYEMYGAFVTSDASIADTLEFSAGAPSGSLFLDDVSLGDVPEPGTISTAIGAILVMAGTMRKRARKHA